jgi:UDP-N-acetylmuramate dehydrogenase
MQPDFIQSLPPLRGKLRVNAELAPTNWFRVGGTADALFRPEDAQDLATFLANLPANIPVMTLGVGSNVIIRDGGIEGVVLKLGRGFTSWNVDDDTVEFGGALLCAQAAELAAAHGISGLEFLVGIPGSIGGALAMNAGAYGREMKDVLTEAEFITRDGTITRVPAEALAYQYRKCPGLPEGAVFTRGWLRGNAGGNKDGILARMQEITSAREASQPVRARTGGSTFKNPEGKKAWELIDAAGCRGLTIGGAQMSEKHCNFMLNTGDASAADLEALGEEVRRRVREHSGIELQWEIKRIGRVEQ